MAVSLFQAMGQNMMHTLVPLYAYNLGATAQMVGVVAGAFAITALAARPFAGPAFDSFSKKRILLVSQIVIIIATFGYSISTTVPVLIGVRLLHGLGMAIGGPICMTLAAEALPSDKMNSGISIFTLSFAVAQCIGPFFGLWLSDTIGFQWTFRVTALFMIVALGLALSLKEKPAKRKPYELKLNRMVAKNALTPASLACLLSMSFSVIGSFIVIYGQLRGVNNIGLYFTVYAALLLLTRPASGKLSDKLGSLKIIPFGLVFFAAALIIISRSATFPMFILAAVVGACGFGVVMPLLQSMALSSVPASERGAASNTNYIGLDVGNLVGPAIAGSVANHLMATGMSEVVSYSWMFVIFVIPIALSFVILLLTKKTVAKNLEENR